MLSKEGLQFILRLTDYFHGHWEDPEWGKRATTQILVQTAILELSAAITDGATRQAVQGAVEKSIATHAQTVTRAAGH